MVSLTRVGLSSSTSVFTSPSLPDRLRSARDGHAAPAASRDPAQPGGYGGKSRAGRRRHRPRRGHPDPPEPVHPETAGAVYPARVVIAPGGQRSMAPSWPSGGPAGHKEIRMAASDARRAGPVPHDREVPAAGPRGPAWTQAGHLFSFVAVATFVLGLMLLVWPEATTIVVTVIIGISLRRRAASR